MSSNRYGQIWHGDHHHINIRFPSTEARLKFREEFEAYHNSHDHDGDIPIFKDVTTKDLKLGTGSRSPEDLMKAETDDTYRITIDGYHWSEIRSYQDNQDLSDYNWYRPPTCCVPPTIVIDSEYVSSADLKRHPLSAIFGNMPDSDFQSLLSSVESDGFIEPVIRMYEGQILDGWHRYRAAQELGIIRKLRFREWNEDSHRDGDPKVFVLARNIERRHLNAAQRAQIAVTFNERFGMGRPTDLQKVHQNGELKTRSELATEANVGTSTIDRAVQVEKAGRAEEVISGEKSASEIIKELTVDELWKQINPAISAWKKEREGVGHASKSMFIKASLRWEGLPSDTETDVKVLKILQNLLTTQETNALEELIRKQLEGKSLWGDASVDAETDDKKTEQPTHEERLKALRGEIRDYIPVWIADADILQPLRGHENKVTLKLLLNAHWHFKHRLQRGNGPFFKEEMESLFEIMKSGDTAFMDKMLKVMEAVAPELFGQQETEQPKQTAEEREANKLLKQKKQAAKLLWDTRKQAAKDWLGDEDNDLTTYTDMDALGKAFAEHNPSYATDFKLAMQRTSAMSFNLMWDKIVSDDVDLDVIQAQFRAVQTFAGDILQWQRPDWSPDTNWILPLIEAKKASAKAKQGETPPKPDRRGCKRELQRIYDFNGHLDNSKEEVVFFDLLKRHHNLDEGTIRALMAEVIEEGNRSDAEKYKDLYDAFEKRVPKWKAKYAESGYKENALIQAATEDDILAAYREHQNSNLKIIHGEAINNSPRPQELKHVTELMQRASYPFAHTLRNMLREDKTESEAEAPDTDADLEKACESLSEVVDDFILCFTDDEGFAMAEYDKLCDVAAVRFGCDRDTLYRLLYDQNVPEHFGTGDLINYEKIVHRMLEDVKSNADWVSKLIGDADDQESTSPKTAEACNLTDEGLAGVDVRALNENVSSLLQSLDASEMDRHFKELLTADLNDVFLQYENPPTVKEMVIALLDTAHRTLSEVIPND